jgi:hypothetical protein
MKRALRPIALIRRTIGRLTGVDAELADAASVLVQKRRRVEQALGRHEQQSHKLYADLAMELRTSLTVFRVNLDRQADSPTIRNLRGRSDAISRLVARHLDPAHLNASIAGERTDRG